MHPSLNPSAESDIYLGGALELKQPSAGLKAGLDSVLLAASVSLKPNQRILDLGSGCFQIGLFLLMREPHIHVWGAEVQPWLRELGQTNISKAHATDRCTQLNTDILLDRLSDLPPNHFDHVVSNPPYFSVKTEDSKLVRQEGPILACPEMSNRTYARQFNEDKSGTALLSWIEVATLKLKQKGSLYLSLSNRQIISAITFLKKNGLGRIEILPLYPNSTKPASRFLVSAIKGSNSSDHTYGGVCLRDHKKAITASISQIAMNPIGVSWSKL